MRQQLHEPHLPAHGQAVDGNVLLCAVQVVQGRLHHVLRLIQAVVIRHGVVARLQRVVKEFRLDPAGADGHHADAARPQLTRQRARIAQHKGLRRGVDIQIRHGLECGQGVQIQQLCAALHVRQRQLRHGHKGLAVQVDHLQGVCQRDLVVAAEFAEARDVRQQADVRPGVFQQVAVELQRLRVRQIEADGPHGEGDLLLQRLKAVGAAGDDPQLVKRLPLGQLQSTLICEVLDSDESISANAC